MPASKDKPITSSVEGSIPESSSGTLPEQEEFRLYLRRLAVSAVQVLLEQVMREELEQCIGASWGECTPTRRGYRNGTYTRDLITPTGRIENLKVPRDREGEFHSQVFERYNRYEPEVAEALTQMFVKGVSTHHVGEVAHTLMGVTPSASAVSRLNQSLIEQFAPGESVHCSRTIASSTQDARSLCGASWRPNRLYHHLNGPCCRPGREQGRAGSPCVCRRRQRWVELPLTRPAHPWCHADGSDCDGWA